MAISAKVLKGLERDSRLNKLMEEGAALKKQFGRDKVFDLTLENPFEEPPQDFRAELQKLIDAPRPGLHRYMENAGYVDTRTAVAKRLSEESSLKFTANEVIMTSGASGALNMAFKALLNPGEEVILISPLSRDYEAYVENHSGLCKIIPSDANFNPNVKALEAAITTRTKAVMINSPHNPTGVVYSEQVLDQIAQVLTRKSEQLKTRIYLISDDTYRKFYYGENRCPWILPLYPHTITVNSYSKDLAVPGERIGYTAVHPGCEDAKTVIGGLIHAIRTLGFVNSPALMQNAVRGASQSLAKITEYKQKRDFLYQQLTKLGYSLSRPEGAFYLFPRTPVTDDFTFANELKNQMVLAIPGSIYRAPGFIRISYCVDDQVIQGSLTGFKKALEKYEKKK